jgi:hypothetical protein
MSKSVVNIEVGRNDREVVSSDFKPVSRRPYEVYTTYSSSAMLKTTSRIDCESVLERSQSDTFGNHRTS